jgi:hypothetical protein
MRSGETHSPPVTNPLSRATPGRADHTRPRAREPVPSRTLVPVSPRAARE